MPRQLSPTARLAAMRAANKRAQVARRARWDAAIKSAGWAGESQLITAVTQGRATLPPGPGAAGEHKSYKERETK